jgi:hypothetical protein
MDWDVARAWQQALELVESARSRTISLYNDTVGPAENVMLVDSELPSRPVTIRSPCDRRQWRMLRVNDFPGVN